MKTKHLVGSYILLVVMPTALGYMAGVTHETNPVNIYAPLVYMALVAYVYSLLSGGE